MMDGDEVSTSLDASTTTNDEAESVDSPRSQASHRSWGCDSVVEICSICPVPSVAKEGVLEVWPSQKDYANESSSEETIPLRELKDMEQDDKALILKFLKRKKPVELRAESASDAVDWFEAIEFVLRSMSMPINYSLCETPVF